MPPRVAQLAREWVVQAVQQILSWRATAEAALRTLLSPQSLAVEEVSELELDDSQKFRFTSPLSRTAVSQLFVGVRCSR